MFTRILLSACLLPCLVVTLTPTARGEAITVGDHSFEGNTLSAGGWNNNIGPEWTGTGGSNNGNAFEEYIAGFAADGTDHLGMVLNYDVWQDLGVTYQANTRYTLTIAAGNRSGSTSSGNLTQYALADSTGAVYATANWDAYTNVAPGTFADAPALVFDTPNNAACVGKTIRVLLQARGANRSHFDNIRLDATSLVPPGGATVVNSEATAITASEATLNGAITAIGNDAPTVTVFWGPADGGITPGNWAYSETLPGTQTGAFSLPVLGLDHAATYYFTARATNSAGDSWAFSSASFDTLPIAPEVETVAATGIAATTATLGANVTSTGGEDPVVTIYYGPTDGGTDPLAWAASTSLGPLAAGGSAPVSGLAANTPYFFRAYAQNSAGGAWAAASLSFTTLEVSLPAVENRPPTGLTGTTANLRGEVTAIGNDIPTVTIFYGTTDGGTDPGSWAASVLVGPQAGEFTRFVASLTPTTPYYFRCRATNAAGAVWAAESGSFATTTLVPSGAVINEFHYNSQDNTSLEEFIELYNPGDAALDLSGWTLSGAVTYTFPAATTLPVGGYLVVAESPAVMLSKFGVAALGPWSGRLSSKGETILLRDAGGVVQDSVEYQAGFPWPTAPDGSGPSCELINPALDNDLGGSWRASVDKSLSAVTYIPTAATGWKYFKGTTEPSPSDVTAWRTVAFDDGTWATGQTPIGIGSTVANNTTLTDMVGWGYSNYTTVYGRKTFTVAANRIPSTLTLRLRVDDGCVAWINGTEVFRSGNLNGGQLAYNATANSGVGTAGWMTIELNGTDVYLNGGTNVLALHTVNRDTRNNRGDFTFDAELYTPAVSLPPPTPGAANGVFRAVDVIPPQIRQVEHTPRSPVPGNPVTITAKITDPDGMGAVTLAYQTVDPGSYVPWKLVNPASVLTYLDNPAYAAGWTTVPMYDDGTNGDVVAGDYVYTAVLASTLQTHRRLVRYKISFADTLGNALTVPYDDDEQPNFAYFTYAGVPSWTGALRPTAFNGSPATAAETYPASLLESIAPFHLIATASDVANCQYNGTYENSRFYGTVVHNGKVYDHIQFRVRGQGSTYLTGKNKWNVYFNRARDYQAYDDLGRPFQETWNNILVNANACPWAAVNRGAAGVEEAVSNRIYEIAGMAAMRTTYLHLRVIDDAVEVSPTSQYEGDLWGLYLGIEPSEGNFLDERGLEDGNIYAIEGNAGDKKRQAPGQPLDSSDWNAFRDTAAATGTSEQWYRDNMDLPSLYTFLGLNRLIGNVDVRPGDNYRYYHRPTDDRWVIFPYDMDMQFIAAHHWGGTMDGVVVAGAPNTIRAIMRHPALALEFRNRCRELLDLMGSDPAPNGGQIGQLIDQFAQIVNPTGQALTWADLDAAMWNLHPRTTGSGADTGQSSHRGNFFRANYRDGTRGGLGGTAHTQSWIRTLPDPDADGFSDHEGLMQWFVNFSTNTWSADRTDWVRKATNTSGGGDDTDADRQKGYGYKYLEWESLYGGYANSLVNPADVAVEPDLAFPDTPTITYAGADGFPANGLAFTSSEFADPQGAGTFGAMEWRLAEIGAPGKAGWVAGTPRKYEIQATWTSGELASFTASIQPPANAIAAGKTYRARVRHRDNTGRWSHWSAPVEFTAAAVDVSVWQQNLVVSEINYHPLPPSTPEETAAAGGDLKNEFEFIELRNISPTVTLDLGELAFTTGITFSFAGSAVTALAPGGYVLVVKNPAAFEARYGTGLPVAGTYAPNSLDNAGEQIVLSRLGTAIRDFTYSDDPPWPTTPDGTGATLVLRDPLSNPDHNDAASWRASSVTGGTPGTGEGKAPQSITFDPPSGAPLDGPPLALVATATSGLPVTFEVVSGPGGLAGALLSFTAGGDVVVRATQAGDANWEVATPVERTIAVTTSWEASDWRATHFTADELDDPALSGATADPDGDGLANLVEYALKTDPRTRDVPPPVGIKIVEDAGQPYHAFFFRRRVPNPQIAYTPEVSTNLAGWRSTAADLVPFGTPSANSDGTETVTYRSTTPATGLPTEFFRLRVTVP